MNPLFNPTNYKIISELSSQYRYFLICSQTQIKLCYFVPSLDSQVAVEPKDYGSTSSWALLHLFTSLSLNQPALLTGVSSRRKQTHLFSLQTQRKFKKKKKKKIWIIWLPCFYQPLLAAPSLGQMDKPRQSGQTPRRKTFEIYTSGHGRDVEYLRLLHFWWNP